jgi:hypothetical protein
MCANGGIEVRPDFRVSVVNDKRPLSKVRVRVFSYAANKEVESFSGLTEADGTVKVSGLSAGEYWLEAERLGIHAAYHCFHVSPRPAFSAKRILKYKWDFYIPRSFRGAAGRVSYTQPGTGGTLLQNITHPASVPIKNARLKLQSPWSEEAFHTVSDEDGAFSFGKIANGIYVLHVEGGTGGSYDATDSLIEITTAASARMLDLNYREAGGGSCGNSILKLGDLKQ